MRSQHIKCDSCGFSCLCPKIRNLPSDQTHLCLNRKRGLISTRWHSRNRKIHHPQGIVSTDIPLRQGQVPSFKIPEVTEPWPLSSLCLCPWIGYQDSLKFWEASVDICCLSSIWTLSLIDLIDSQFDTTGWCTYFTQFHELLIIN